ncbi:MAG: DUF4238 domain-containing protein [Alteraurantiacibacter sp.]
MAGKNQHFIPQFLQKGFVSPESGDGGFGRKPKKAKKKRSKVWVFDRGEEAYHTSIRNKGAERFFYGLEGSVADTRITDAESEYAGLVNELRTNTANTYLSSNSLCIAKLVAHLFIRTKHVRSSLEEAGDLMLEMTENLLGNRADFERFVRIIFQKKAGEIEEGLYDSLTSAQQKVARRKLKESPELLSAALEQVTTEMVASNPFSAPFLKRFKDELPSMARNAHIETFSESVAPADRIEQLRAFHWFLHTETCDSLILGDTISLCQTSDGQYKSYLAESKKCERILLPVSSQHILVGSTDSRMQKLDIEAINHASAAISRDFFIASKNTDRERSYAQLINTKSFVIEPRELENVKEKIQQEYFS